MEDISSISYQNFWAGSKWTNPCCPHDGFSDGDNDCNAVSMISGDFDNDLRADQVMLYSSKMVFFFSSDRERGELPDNTNHIGLTIDFPDYCMKGLSLQAVDIDNDGKEEIMVSCINAGVFLLYTNTGEPKKWTLDNGCNDNDESLGDLTNRFLSIPTQETMDEFCEIYSKIWNQGKRICAKYKQVGVISPKSKGMSIVDLNGDGFLDVITTSSFGHLRFFYNKPSQMVLKNRFICFRLVGTPHIVADTDTDTDTLLDNKATNYYGIGATVILYARDENGAAVKQFREVSSVQHHTDFFGSKDSSRIIFGLGETLTPISISIRWSKGQSKKENNTQRLTIKGWRFSKLSSLEPIEILDLNGKYVYLVTIQMNRRITALTFTCLASTCCFCDL